MMDQEELEEIVHVLLDMMPNEISNKDLSIVVINFVIQKKMADRWPIISAAIGMVLTRQVEGKKIKDAVQAADNFLGRIVNGAG